MRDLAVSVLVAFALVSSSMLLAGGVVGPAQAAPGEVYVQVGEFGTQGSGEGQFDYPFDVAVLGDRVYVADSHNNRVQVFDLAGNYLFQWGGTGTADGQFRRNRGVGTTPFTGTGAAVFVSDAKNDRVQKFTPEGLHLASWGSIGDGPDQFFRPRPVAVAGNGFVIVGDMNNHRVKIHGPDLALRHTIGELGESPGQFHTPYDVAVWAGQLYVADHRNSRIQVFTLGGVYLDEFGGPPPAEHPLADGHFWWPMGMTVDPKGNLFVVDTDHPEGMVDRIQKFSSDGEWLATFGGHGSGTGELSRPTGIASDAFGRLFVSDSENARITIWARQAVPATAESFSSFKARFDRGRGQ
jgi:DNA-binding beta-propeller fold protein YncE